MLGGQRLQWRDRIDSSVQSKYNTVTTMLSSFACRTASKLRSDSKNKQTDDI